MKKVFLISLGCSKNLVDSEHILGLLKDNGYEVVLSESQADIVVINTCGFISDSKMESINQILNNINKSYKLVVTGCLIERYIDELKKEIPEVDLYIPIKDYDKFPLLLKSLDEEVKVDKTNLFSYDRVVSTGHFSAYLRIGDGCDNRCSYCAIPLIRGPYRSTPMEDILKEAHRLKDLGYKEIVVLEQDTTKYGSDLKNTTIITLLKSLLEIKEFDYIRLLYLYPDEIRDELIELIKNEERLTPYFDIPIQHSEDHVLLKMNRRGNKAFLKDLFTKIRTQIPNAVLRTTLLVGFPGETKEDVNNLNEFIKEIGFDHLGVFTYSKEEGTASYNFPNQVSKKEKQRRKDLLMKTQQKISYERNKKHVGEIMEGLIIKKESNYYLFRSYWNAPDDIDGKIYIKNDREVEVGQKVKVKITNSYIYDLVGKFL